MRTFFYHKAHILPYHPDDMFSLVLDIERYPAFVPYCHRVAVQHHDDHHLSGTLFLQKNLLSWSFVSDVTHQHPEKIVMTSAQGPFQHLEGQWGFDHHATGCRVTFQMALTFHSLIEKLAFMPFAPFLTEKMLEAFISRAHHLYGRCFNDSASSSTSTNTCDPS